MWHKVGPHRSTLGGLGQPHQVAHCGPALLRLLLVLDFLVHVYSFLHKQRSPSTSGNRSIININHYYGVDLLPFWCNVDDQNWSLVTNNKLPHTKPLLALSEALK